MAEAEEREIRNSSPIYIKPRPVGSRLDDLEARMTRVNLAVNRAPVNGEMEDLKAEIDELRHNQERLTSMVETLMNSIGAPQLSNADRSENSHIRNFIGDMFFFSEDIMVSPNFDFVFMAYKYYINKTEIKSIGKRAVRRLLPGIINDRQFGIREEYNYPCPECNKHFFSERALRTHVPIHSHNSDVDVPCPVGSCAFETKSKRAWFLHIGKAHPEYKGEREWPV